MSDGLFIVGDSSGAGASSVYYYSMWTGESDSSYGRGGHGGGGDDSLLGSAGKDVIFGDGSGGWQGIV